jgi:hypothetical protein
MTKAGPTQKDKLRRWQQLVVVMEKPLQARGSHFSAGFSILVRWNCRSNSDARQLVGVTAVTSVVSVVLQLVLSARPLGIAGSPVCCLPALWSPRSVDCFRGVYFALSSRCVTEVQRI